jgi:hypothetical protein
MLRPLYPQERDPVPIVQEVGWAPGSVWMGVENLTPTRIQFLDHPAHSTSLYQLHCPSPEIINVAEYPNAEYEKDQFVYIVKSHESNQPNMNSTINTVAEVNNN